VVVSLFIVGTIISTTAAVTPSGLEMGQATASAYLVDQDGDGRITWDEFLAFVTEWIIHGGQIPDGM
jgi:hypothetical protein